MCRIIMNTCECIPNITRSVTEFKKWVFLITLGMLMGYSIHENTEGKIATTLILQ